MIQLTRTATSDNGYLAIQWEIANDHDRFKNFQIQMCDGNLLKRHKKESIVDVRYMVSIMIPWYIRNGAVELIDSVHAVLGHNSVSLVEDGRYKHSKELSKQARIPSF